MLAAEKSLEEAYEIISSEDFTIKKASQKGNKFTKIKKINFREHVKYLPQTPKKDLRLQKSLSSLEELEEFIESSLYHTGYSNLSVQDHLKKLAIMMMDRFQKKILKCQMELIYSDSFKSFNEDKFTVRSITTLAGPGTELKFKNDPYQTYKVETGDSLLVKGSYSRGVCDQVVLHSPRLSHLGIARLVFIMDC